jgi:NADPH:quinone reductase-like Zn-dependent oxidoreductase
MATMKAVRMHRYGGPDVLSYEDAPQPEPAVDELLVRVHAAGINPVDWKIREGHLKGIPHTLPLILGWDVSGVVERIGTGATGFAVGDEIYARPDLTRNGAYAEYIVVRVSEAAKKPRSIDHVQAASLPLAGLTAWQGLFEAPPSHSSIGLTAGQTILIHGAAGGVGSLVVQLAKWKGARVIGTSSGANAELLRNLGVDQHVDYTTQRFEDVVHGVDAVFDTIGGDTQTRSWGVLKPGGVLLSIVSRPDEEAAKAHGARAAFVFIAPSAKQLTTLAQLVDENKLKPIVTDVMPLVAARKAHELSQGGHVRGKIVLEVASA